MKSCRLIAVPIRNTNTWKHAGHSCFFFWQVSARLSLTSLWQVGTHFWKGKNLLRIASRTVLVPGGHIMLPGIRVKYRFAHSALLTFRTCATVELHDFSDVCASTHHVVVSFGGRVTRPYGGSISAARWALVPQGPENSPNKKRVQTTTLIFCIEIEDQGEGRYCKKSL